MNICANCPNEVKEKYRKLCWTCTNWKRKYGTTNPVEVQEKKDRIRPKRTCVLCGDRSNKVVPGVYTSTGKDMCKGCSWSFANLKEILHDPVKKYLLKEKGLDLGI